MNSKKKLNILLTNDDGIFAEGINVLAEKLRTVANVYMLAPETNRSAVSSHIVMDTNLVFKKTGENAYSCSGYPADCVISALRSDIFKDVKFDAVFSGINKGPNMGTDCIYSGTVAAARQAVLYGYAGVAVSLKAPDREYGDGQYHYEALADFIAKNLDAVLSLFRPDVIISINGRSQDSYKGVKLTSLCIRDYNDKVVLKENSEGNLESVFRSGSLKTTGPEDNEYLTVKEGYIAISRLRAEPVNYSEAPDEKINFVF